MQETNNRPSFCEWFDPHNIEHIKAYVCLQETGTWPRGFTPENIYIEFNWQPILAFKLANEWIRYKLHNPSRTGGA